MDEEGSGEGAVKPIVETERPGAEARSVVDTYDVPTDDLRDLFENASLGIHFVSQDGTILAANKAELKLLGYSAAEYIGRNIREFHADTAALDDIMASLTGGDALSGYEAQLICKDGSLKDVSIDSSVRRSADGDFLHTRCFTQDNSFRKLMEEAALRLATIVESSDDAIVSKSLDGTIRTWNRAAERIFGFRADEAIGKSIRVIIPDDRQAEEDEVLSRVRQGLRIDHFDTVRRRKDGSSVEISLTVSPVRDHAGRIIGASKIARDITFRKRAEELARESIAAKEDFLTLVSHELRTPVSVIAGVARVLHDRFDALSETERRTAFSDLDTHARRLTQIIEHLLILTRLTSDDRLELEPVLLERIAADVAERYRERFPSRTIAFSADDLPIASANASLTHLVMDNLISNALKYSSGPIEIVCTSPSSDAIAVDVLDRGIGLNELEAADLFEPFYRTRAAKDTAPGMGLGRGLPEDRRVTGRDYRRPTSARRRGMVPVHGASRLGPGCGVTGARHEAAS